jgi:hypothetical protein
MLLSTAFSIFDTSVILGIIDALLLVFEDAMDPKFFILEFLCFMNSIKMTLNDIPCSSANEIQEKKRKEKKKSQ